MPTRLTEQEYNEKARERLMKNVTIADAPYPALGTSCWNFEGALANKGRGNHRFFHYTPSEGRPETYAHRASYRLFIGSIPDGLMIRHRCDNPSCVNPKHLEPGTHQDNMDDMALRSPGRAASGIKGVYRSGNGWSGGVTFRGKLVRVWFKIKDDAAAWVHAKRQQLHGLIPASPLASSAQLTLF